MAKKKTQPDSTLIPLAQVGASLVSRAPRGASPSPSGREHDPAFQATMAGIVRNAAQMTGAAAPSPSGNNEDNKDRPLDVKRLTDALEAVAADRAFEGWLESLSHFEGIDRIFNALRSSPEGEARESALAARDAEFSRFCDEPGKGGAAKSSRASCVRDDGFRVPRFKMNPEEQSAARVSLATAIHTASAEYALGAGISQKDMVRTLGAIATIESSFGTQRSVVGAKYASSAGGAMHYLNGTIAAEVRANMRDPRIAERVASLGVNPADGIGESEAWTLKNDDLLATRLVAIGVAELARKRPELAGNPEALATHYYMRHNLGPGGANALLHGGVAAVGEKAAANNPLFFRGAGSSAEVVARYQKFVSGAMASADTLMAQLPRGQSTLAAKKETGLPSPHPA